MELWSISEFIFNILAFSLLGLLVITTIGLIVIVVLLVRLAVKNLLEEIGE